MPMQAKKPKGTRKGYTTGACAAAATKAAVLGLITGEVPAQVETLLPNGTQVLFAVTEANCDAKHAHAVVIKDAGDDPDCTHKAHLTADVQLLPVATEPKIQLFGGDGVGTITMRGLGLEVGSAAINPVPRNNILANIHAIATELLQKHSLAVTISVPDGEKMALKTLNARLGIVGGISILGTTGIVHPYSTAAFRASVVQGVEVAANRGLDTIVLTTGGRTEKFTIKTLPDLDSASFVQMGDFLGPALDSANKTSIKHIIIGGMVGKLTKIAQGETITHARRNVVNTDLLAEIARSIGVAENICAEISQAETARYAGERMQELGLNNEFYQALARKVVTTLSTRYPQRFSFSILVCDFEGQQLAHYQELLNE